ncbi:hypothetical protein RRF57_006790 [Xylaria bambusicola]|uniref:Uncharacterized protein n=1 Tax=Xylaria bambusicola TaxID=326684 RepID=A0AAN7UF22_9PEZI
MPYLDEELKRFKTRLIRRGGGYLKLTQSTTDWLLIPVSTTAPCNRYTAWEKIFSSLLDCVHKRCGTWTPRSSTAEGRTVLYNGLSSLTTAEARGGEYGFAMPVIPRTKAAEARG